MAVSEVYVDPSIAADSGTGTIGDPYGDLSYAIKQTTFDTTNGTRVNIKAGTDEVLAEEIQVSMADVVTTVAWAPSKTAPLIFQGYTAVAGDGGIGGINCNTTHGYNDATIDYINWRDLVIHNSGTNEWLTCGDHGMIMNCEFHTASGTIGLNCGAYNRISGIYVHSVTVTGQAVYLINSVIENSFVDVSNATATYGIYTSTSAWARHCIVVTGGTASGYLSANSGGWEHCIAYDSSGTSTGDGFVGGGSAHGFTALNCIAHGFGGAGGGGFRQTAGGPGYKIHGCAAYGCTNPFTDVDLLELSYWGDNEVLTADPFNDAANYDFSPVDTGNVIEGAIPNHIGTLFS